MSISTLVIGTRGMGWFLVLPLPQPGATVDAHPRSGLWSYRAGQYDRTHLSRDFTQGCRE